MKIAVASTSDNVDEATVTRLGTCSHLLIIDTDTMASDAIPCPPVSEGRGAGIRMVTLASGHGAAVVMTTYVRPQMEAGLDGSGIELVTGVEGTVRSAVDEYLERRPAEGPEEQASLRQALRRSCRQFGAMIPVLIGVVLLAGLLKVFISREFLTSIFSGEPITDTLWGAVAGSIFAGNAVNSYIIGAALHDAGVSLFAVTALIITWVTVGIVQLPAEASTLGTRFAVLRTSAAFVASLGVAMLTVVMTGWFS